MPWQDKRLSLVSQYTDLSHIPVTQLAGVGDRIAAKLARLNLHSVQDLLFHLPVRYEDRTRVVPIAELRSGQRAVIEGRVTASRVIYARRRMLVCEVEDASGSLTLKFFHFNSLQQKRLAAAETVRCFGLCRFGRSGLEMIHPEFENRSAPAREVHLTPVYPLTEGIHQLKMRGLVEQALQIMLAAPEKMQDWIPAEILRQMELPGLVQALEYIHRPPCDVPLEELMYGESGYIVRLAFEELLAHRLSMRLARRRLKAVRAHGLNTESALVNRFVSGLPFSLTGAQQRVIAEVVRDLGRPEPMMRLVHGDVGSGKTLVAAVAALHAIDAGHQAALMAPTEILAEQHFQTFSSWFEALGCRIAYLSSRISAADKKKALAQIEDGSAQLVIGTHALFQQQVSFRSLALIVVDEQHRFGVHQRMALKQKGGGDGLAPHQLIMTATPIPRTLAMISYADLDISVIDELPAGRRPVRTVVLPDTRRDQVMQRVYVNCRQGRQAYWVCPLIDESELIACQAAEETLVQLKSRLPDLRIGLVHGRMKTEDKSRVMQAFKDAGLDLLVATTVIEVGVDVPNASLMIIENAERLGLAQLHQLRGRVGRGNLDSACVLLYQSPLGELAGKRLAAMRDSNDGFYIANRDLELRGPGEVFGARQTGAIQFRIADLDRDKGLLDSVQQAAERLIEQNEKQAYLIIRRWIGESLRYAAV